MAQTLKSVLSQTYSNFEVLVVDDGCQDKTPEIVELMVQKDRRLTLLGSQIQELLLLAI